MKEYPTTSQLQMVGALMFTTIREHAYEEGMPGWDAVVRKSQALELLVNVMVCVVMCGACLCACELRRKCRNMGVNIDVWRAVYVLCLGCVQKIVCTSPMYYVQRPVPQSFTYVGWAGNCTQLLCG